MEALKRCSLGAVRLGLQNTLAKNSAATTNLVNNRKYPNTHPG